MDERESLVDLEDARAALNQGLEKLRREVPAESLEEMDERERCARWCAACIKGPRARWITCKA